MAFRCALAGIQDALAEAVRGELPEAVPFDIGFPDRGPAGEHVWIDGAFEANLPTYLSGGGLRDEAGELRVVISIARDRGPMTTLRDRALELAGCVEDAVAADATLGGAAERAWVSKVSGLYALPEKRRQFYVTVTVSYEVTASG